MNIRSSENTRQSNGHSFKTDSGNFTHASEAPAPWNICTRFCEAGSHVCARGLLRRLEMPVSKKVRSKGSSIDRSQAKSESGTISVSGTWLVISDTTTAAHSFLWQTKTMGKNTRDMRKRGGWNCKESVEINKGKGGEKWGKSHYDYSHPQQRVKCINPITIDSFKTVSPKTCSLPWDALALHPKKTCNCMVSLGPQDHSRQRCSAETEKRPWPWDERHLHSWWWWHEKKKFYMRSTVLY